MKKLLLKLLVVAIKVSPGKLGDKLIPLIEKLS